MGSKRAKAEPRTPLPRMSTLRPKVLCAPSFSRGMHHMWRRSRLQQRRTRALVPPPSAPVRSEALRYNWPSDRLTTLWVSSTSRISHTCPGVRLSDSGAQLPAGVLALGEQRDSAWPSPRRRGRGIRAPFECSARAAWRPLCGEPQPPRRALAKSGGRFSRKAVKASRASGELIRL